MLPPRAFREGFPVDESYPVGHVTKRAGLEMRTMEEEAVRGGAGAGQMAPSGGAASFPLWLLLRGRHCCAAAAHDRPYWDRAQRAAPAVPQVAQRQCFQHGVASLSAMSHPPTQVDGARSLPLQKTLDHV